jgi:hypothetical protein
VLVVPRVLVAFDKDGIALSDQEPGGRVAREVIFKGECLPLIFVANRWFYCRPRQRRRRRAAAHQPALIHLVEMALATDEEGYTLTRPAGADRVAIARAVPGVRATLGKPRPRRRYWVRCGRSRRGSARVFCRRRCTTSDDGSKHARSRQRLDDCQQPEEMGVQHSLR